MSNNLRTQVLQGGTYLVLRRASSIFLNLLNIILLTKIMGLAGYGLYTSVIIIYGYISNLSQLGVSVYLIRQDSVTDDDYHQTFSLCTVLSLIGLLLGILVIPIVSTVTDIKEIAPVLFSMIFALPITLTTAVPAAILERGLQYKKLTITDLFGQIVFSVIGLSLVALGLNIWGVVIGWWAQQLTVSIVLFKYAEYKPHLRWNFVKIKRMLGYGFSFSLSIWIWQARDLANPLIVGHYAGAEGVGIVALVIRLAQALSFIKDATWRLSIAAFAQIQNDKGKLLSAVKEGMFLQILALGPILITFNWIGAWILPRFFNMELGEVLNLFPFVALGLLVNAAFNMHSAALYVLHHNQSVANFHLVYIILFIGITMILIPHYGTLGYGLAELAAMPSYYLIAAAVNRQIGAVSISQALLMLIVFASAMLTHYLGWEAALALLILPLNRNIRRDAGKMIRVVLSQINFKRYLKFGFN